LERLPAIVERYRAPLSFHLTVLLGRADLPVAPFSPRCYAQGGDPPGDDSDGPHSRRPHTGQDDVDLNLDVRLRQRQGDAETHHDEPQRHPCAAADRPEVAVQVAATRASGNDVRLELVMDRRAVEPIGPVGLTLPGHHYRALEVHLACRAEVAA